MAAALVALLVLMASACRTTTRDATPEEAAPQQGAVPLGTGARADSGRVVAPPALASSSGGAAAEASSRRFAGDYRASRHAIKLSGEVGYMAAWLRDKTDQELEGKIQLQIASSGSVSGTASGSMGKHVLTGIADEERLTFDLTPEREGPSSFGGVASCSAQGSAWDCALSLATRDARLVRHGSSRLLAAGPGLGNGAGGTGPQRLDPAERGGTTP